MPLTRSRLLLTAVALVLAVASCAYDVEVGEAPPLDRTSEVYAADGRLITTLHDEQDRTPVALDEMSPHIVQAVIAIEDARFFDHDGVDLRGTLRAAMANAREGRVAEGGSTITQQLVKNILLDDEQTLERKVQEALMAREVEQEWTKQEILERYLNTVYFGAGAYGVEAAAERFFGTTAEDLTLIQSAMLAGLIAAPEAYHPFNNRERSLERRALVLGRMADLGMISPEQRLWATEAPIDLDPGEDRYAAPHFVEAVKRIILADPRFGETREERRHLLFRRGLRIDTTVDLHLQSLAEAALHGVLPAGPDQPKGAVAVVDPNDGRVRALAGGDFWSDEATARVDFATQARRQTGSAFKPFALAAALLTDTSRLEPYDSPGVLEFPMPDGQDPWRVRNYGNTSHGEITLEEATIQSSNTVFAQLIMQLGADTVTRTAQAIGIRRELAAVPAAVLGANDVTPLDAALAYGTFASGGVYHRPVVIERVTAHDGTVLFEAEPAGTRVIPEPVAHEVTGILRQVIERGTARRADIGRPAAGKTGTTQSHRDAWFIGYTPQLVASVWVGFPTEQSAMIPPRTPIRVTGGSWPAEVWARFMGAAHDGVPVIDFAPPPPPAPPSSPDPDEELAEFLRGFQAERAG